MFRFVFCSLSWSILLSGWLFCYFDPTCNQNKVLGWYFKPDGTKWKLEWLQAEVKPFKVELATLGKPHQPGVQVDNLHHVQPLHDILHHVQHFHASYNMLHPKGHVEPHHETNVHADGLLQGDLCLFFKLNYPISPRPTVSWEIWTWSLKERLSIFNFIWLQGTSMFLTMFVLTMHFSNVFQTVTKRRIFHTFFQL